MKRAFSWQDPRKTYARARPATVSHGELRPQRTGMLTFLLPMLNTLSHMKQAHRAIPATIASTHRAWRARVVRRSPLIHLTIDLCSIARIYHAVLRRCRPRGGRASTDWCANAYLWTATAVTPCLSHLSWPGGSRTEPTSDCGRGGIGRHARFRFWWPKAVGVRVPPSAPCRSIPSWPARRRRSLRLRKSSRVPPPGGRPHCIAAAGSDRPGAVGGLS